MFKKLTIITLAIATTLSLTSPIFAQAEGISTAGDDILNEFCNRRQGNVINLETWYAGKCHPEGDQSTFSGDSLGFGDIIILHFYELIKGSSSSQGDADILKEVINGLPNLGSDSGQKFDQIAFLRKYGEVAGRNNDSIASGMSKLIAFPFSRQPASTSEYIASIRQNLRDHQIVQPAYAQNSQGEGGGYGFARLEGFLPLWRAFRNMAYFFFILAFVIYGFMIMFRVKINPQTAANIQLALPQLVITLLLITFSYAIVGLMIDFMWVIYYLVLNSLYTFGVIGNNPTSFGSIEGAFSMLVSGQIGLIPAAIAHFVVAIVAGVPGAFSALLGVNTIIGTAVGGAVLLGVGIISAGAIPILLGLILAIAIIIAFIKLTVKLITAYVTIIGNLVLAPLILLGGVLPGKSDAFSGWITNIIANLMVFPVASLLLLFSGIFMAEAWVDVGRVLAGQSSLPPAVPLLYPAATDNLGIGPGAGSWYALIGLALLLMSPKFVDMIMDAFKLKPFPYGSAAMESLMAGAAGREAAIAYSDKDSGRAINQLGAAFGQKLSFREKDNKPTPAPGAGGPGGGP